MPKHKSYGPVVKGRARCLLDALLRYINHDHDRELTGLIPARLHLRWRSETPELAVEAEMRSLKYLISLMVPNSHLSESQLKEVLKRLQDLEILEDNRVKTQGSSTWIFTLKLWSRDRMENLKRFDQRWDQQCQQLGLRLNLPPATLLPPQIPPPLRALVRDLTAEFVGRQPIFAIIDRFLQEQACGYLWLQSDPGAGKTTCLAHYVQQTGCAAYLHWQAMGEPQVETVIDDLCDQLTRRFLPRSTWQHHPQRLALLLQEIASRGAGDRPGPVVIVIDCADQIESLSAYLPASLPEGVFLLLSRYRNSTLPPLLSPQHTLDLDRQDPGQDQALRDYVRRSLAQQPRSVGDLEWLSSSDQRFVEELVRRSQGNFRYASHVLRRYREIRPRLDPPDLFLPRSLFPYYEHHWRRMGLSISPYPRSQLQISASLVYAQHPISCLEIAAQTQVDPITVQSVLESWGTYLRVHDQGEEIRYALFHPSFQVFLRRKPILQLLQKLTPSPLQQNSTTLDPIRGVWIRESFTLLMILFKARDQVVNGLSGA